MAKKTHKTVLTETAILFSLTPEEQKQSQECLKKSKKIKVTFKEIQVTELPATLENGRLID